MMVPPGGLAPEGERPKPANAAAAAKTESAQIAVGDVAPASTREVASIGDDQSLMHNILVSIFGSEQQLERWKPNDGMALAVGVPVAIGFLVSIFVAGQRRWRRRKGA